MPGDLTRRTLLGHMALAPLVMAQGTQAASFVDPLKTLRREHPRLVALDSDLERIRALVREHPLAKKVKANLDREAEKLMTAPPIEYRLAGPRLQAQSRRALDRIYTLALLFRLDQKPEHLQRALKELRAGASFPDWNPGHFLDLAEMTHAFAIGYDWLYPSLDAADRESIRRAIVEKGLDPALFAYSEPAFWVTGGHTWNLVSNSGVALGALAVADEDPDRSGRVLRNALASLPRAISAYAPDGGWAGGPAHWNFGTRHFVCLLAGLESALSTDFGLTSARGVDKTGRFRVYTTGPTGRPFNYSDAPDDPAPAPEMFWMARRFSHPVYAWQEQRDIDRSTRVDPLDLAWFYKDARSPEAEGWPLDALFAGIHVATFRSDWEDPNAIFLAVKGGDNKEEYAHLDLGSFVLDAGGVRWVRYPGLEDGGAMGPSSRQRLNSFRTRTEAHSTLLVDGENQNPKAESRLLRHQFSPDLSWVEFDLSHAHPSKVKEWRRRVGLAQRQAVLIQDQLTAEQPVEALWSMVIDAEITCTGQTAELTKNGWVLSAEIHSPHHAVFDVVSSQGTKELVVRLGPKTTDLDLNIVLIPHKAGYPKPKIGVRFPA
jgi:hypothetical protein